MSIGSAIQSGILGGAPVGMDNSALDLSSSMVKGIGRLKGGLYIFNPSAPAILLQLCYSFTSTKFKLSVDVVFKEGIFPFKYSKHRFLVIPNPTPSHLVSDIFLPSNIEPEPSTINEPEFTIPDPSNDSIDSPASFSNFPAISPIIPTHSSSSIPTLLAESSSDIPDESNSHSSAIPVTYPTQVSKSGRVSKPPIWLTDYVRPSLPSTSTSTLSLYPIHQFISYSHLSPTFQSYLASFSFDIEPTSFSQAMAMKLEIEVLEQNNTWEVVNLPPGKVPIRCKWVYKIKYNADGIVERFKARLEAKSYTRQEGIDFHDTFSPVAKMTTIRTVIAVAVLKQWSIYQMDVHKFEW
uniref:Reverse transcriptase Ty1/copia-type domain-containing protein n=1 Tax=Nicotiana tabacum TaxID=4097 RepID=A0A1S4BNH9_TOBAC|nr:PREDICTED: uncharacterized protein LOC107810171 [Nicotiana tabacum]